MNLGDSIRRNSFWLLSGRIGGRLLEFVFGIILARILAPEDFGLLVTIQVFTGALGFISGGGMSDALVQAKTVEKNDYYVVFTVQLAIGAAIYLCLFFLAPYVAGWFNESLYTDLLRVTAITFLLRPFAGIPSSILRREMRFKSVAAIRLCALSASGSFSVLFATLGMGTWSLVFGGLVGTMTSISVLLHITHWTPRFAINRTTVRTLGAYGVRMSLNDLIIYGRAQTSNLLISHQLGASSVGLFNRANSLAETPFHLIVGSAYQTVFRALSSIQENSDQSAYIFLRAITIVSFYSIPVYCCLFWVADAFIGAVYGPQWADAALPLQIFSAVGFFRIFANLSGAVIAAQDQIRKEIPIQIAAWIILISGVLIGLNWGIIGVAAAVIPSQLFLAWRKTKTALAILNINWSDLWRAVLPVAKLNAALFLLLFISHHALLLADTLPTNLIYLFLLVSIAFVAYSGLFLYRPDDQLKTEAQRWHTFFSDILERAKLMCNHKE